VGSDGPRKAADRRANGVDTRRLRQCLQELSPPGLQLGCKDPTWLNLLSAPVRSSISCTLGNTEIPWLSLPTLSPGYPDDPDDQLNLAWTIEVPGQFYSVPGKAWLSSAELTATSLPCHDIVMAEFCGASSFLSLIPFGCILAMTHLSASTLFLLFVTYAFAWRLSSNVGSGDIIISVI